jgi:hypothetical protein
LDLVFQPTITSPGGPMDDGTMPTRRQRDLLLTESWEYRPYVEDLLLAASEMAETINELGTTERWTLLDACLHNPLVEPTALFPTEVRVGAQSLHRLLGYPIDLYLVFN